MISSTYNWLGILPMMLLFLTACGGGGGSATPVEPPAPVPPVAVEDSATEHAFVSDHFSGSQNCSFCHDGLQDAGGSDDVQVGVNGSVMLVPRGKDVDIPYRYYEALKNAVADKYEMMPDGKSMNPVPRKVPAYPFQVVATA